MQGTVLLQGCGLYILDIPEYRIAHTVIVSRFYGGGYSRRYLGSIDHQSNLEHQSRPQLMKSRKPRKSDLQYHSLDRIQSICSYLSTPSMHQIRDKQTCFKVVDLSIRFCI